jgi:hypothetical protein
LGFDEVKGIEVAYREKDLKLAALFLENQA